MATPGWYLLIHQLPPEPLYLRAKVRNRLARVGALALKNSVYVLPARPSCLEDFQWIAQEAATGGGEAFVCEARFLAGVDDRKLTGEFRRAAAEGYETVLAEMARLRAPVAADDRARLARRLADLDAIDFFSVPQGREAHAMLEKLDSPGPGGPKTRKDPVPTGRTWVTRRDPHVDRLASAWLIRRFIDPRARFRFIDAEREGPRPREIGFDMVGAAYTHEGDRCTFETLVARFGIRGEGVRAIAEIVHDLDLKDGRYGRPETAGVSRLLAGLYRGCPDDAVRVQRAIALFDDLYASFGGGPTGTRRPAPKGGRRGGGRR